MKILILTQYFYPESFKINLIAEELSKNGFEIAVLTSIPNYPDGKIYNGYRNLFISEKYKNITVYRVPIIPRGNGSSIKLMLNYLSFFINATLRIFLLKKYDKILIFAPSPVTSAIPAMLVNYFWHAKVYFWILDLWPESVQANIPNIPNLAINLLNKIVKYIYIRSDQILIPCKGFANQIVKYGISTSKIKYIPNYGEDIELLKNNRTYSEFVPLGINILYAGNIGNSQDFETIFKVARRLKEKYKVYWQFVGGGRRLDWLKEQIIINELEDTMFTYGQKEISDLVYFYNNSDVLIVSLKNKPIFHLTIPAKLQSYMAVGRPIISGLLGEGEKVIKEAKCGFSYIPEDAESLEQAVVNLVNIGKEERNKIGRNGRKYYEENYSFKRVIDRLNTILIGN